MSLFKMEQQILDVIHEACCAPWNKTLPLSSSSPVHSYTDPALTPTAQPNVHTPPAPALYWNCSKAVKTPSFSHSLHPQRAGLKRTPSHALTDAHTRNAHSQKNRKKSELEGGYMHPCILTQVGQSCSGSSKQTSSTMVETLS